MSETISIISESQPLVCKPWLFPIPSYWQISCDT